MTSCSLTALSRHGGLAGSFEGEQKHYFEEKRLYTLQIESTDACPQDCVFCYAGCTEDSEAGGLTSTEIVDALQTAANFGVRAIDWLGGDPLVRPDWYELMCEARALGLRNNLWTSGLPLTLPGVAEKVVSVTKDGFVSVHVDSIHPETFSRLHRKNGGEKIQQVVAGVDKLQALGKKPDEMINCITFTSAQEPEDAIETMKWWREKKGMRTCLTMFNPAGMGGELHGLSPSQEVIQHVYEARDFINYGDNEATLACMDTDKFYCGTMATLTFSGDVTPCSVIRHGVGNIRRTPLARIFQEQLGTLVHAKLHDTCDMPAPCDSCADNEHCWGCRASAYNYSGNADGLDPKCWRITELEQKSGE
jgi:MoaA/NifB/PqqE/SkfB family radical SAM enzyme